MGGFPLKNHFATGMQAGVATFGTTCGADANSAAGFPGIPWNVWKIAPSEIFRMFSTSCWISGFPMWLCPKNLGEIPSIHIYEAKWCRNLLPSLGKCIPHLASPGTSHHLCSKVPMAQGSSQKISTRTFCKSSANTGGMHNKFIEIWIFWMDWW